MNSQGSSQLNDISKSKNSDLNQTGDETKNINTETEDSSAKSLNETNNISPENDVLKEKDSNQELTNEGDNDKTHLVGKVNPNRILHK